MKALPRNVMQLLIVVSFVLGAAVGIGPSTVFAADDDPYSDHLNPLPKPGTTVLVFDFEACDASEQDLADEVAPLFRMWVYETVEFGVDDPKVVIRFKNERDPSPEIVPTTIGELKAKFLSFNGLAGDWQPEMKRFAIADDVPLTTDPQDAFIRDIDSVLGFPNASTLSESVIFGILPDSRFTFTGFSECGDKFKRKVYAEAELLAIPDFPWECGPFSQLWEGCGLNPQEWASLILAPDEEYPWSTATPIDFIRTGFEDGLFQVAIQIRRIDSSASAGQIASADVETGTCCDRSIKLVNLPSPSTAVDLVSFTVEEADGGVNISWTTASETDNAGFNVYRAKSLDGPFSKVNEKLIAAGGEGIGASYTFHDPDGKANQAYQLEDVEVSGLATRHNLIAIAQADIDHMVFLPIIGSR